MTGYQSKKAMAQDKLAQLAQEPTLQEQLDKTYAKWNKDGAELLKAYAEIKGTRVTCIINDGINMPSSQEKNNGT